MTPQSTAVLSIAEAPPRRWQERYDAIFDAALAKLHSEGRYRVFIDILRNKGSFPDALCFAGHSGPKPITVWCSNDYLSLGQQPKVIAAMEKALHAVGAVYGGQGRIGGNRKSTNDNESTIRKEKDR